MKRLLPATLLPPTLLLGLFGTPAAAADLPRGQKVYQASCLACHGVNADGKGPAAAALKPRPTDFTSADFWKGRSDDSIKQVIQSGKPGTSMMGFGQLQGEDLDAAVAFLRSKAP